MQFLLRERAAAFRPSVQILRLTDPRRDLIKAQRIDLEGRDLSYLEFLGRDLIDVSFRNADLRNTRFHCCELQESHFEGAHLFGTRFEALDKEALRKAAFGGLEHFNHVFIEDREIDEPDVMSDWVNSMTGVTAPVQACNRTSIESSVSQVRRCEWNCEA